MNFVLPKGRVACILGVPLENHGVSAKSQSAQRHCNGLAALPSLRGAAAPSQCGRTSSKVRMCFLNAVHRVRSSEKVGRFLGQYLRPCSAGHDRGVAVQTHTPWAQAVGRCSRPRLQSLCNVLHKSQGGTSPQHRGNFWASDIHVAEGACS